MTIIDGKEVAAKLRKEIAAEVEAWVASGHRAPHLVAILVGNDGASQTYVGHKEKCCAEVGFRSTVLRLDEAISEAYLLGEIAKLNNDPDVDGFIVQLPLPKHISEQKVIEAIDPRKDVDGFHPINTGRMISGLPSYRHAGRHPRAAQTLRYRNLRQELRRYRPQQHSRPSDRKPALAKRLGLHRYDVPQPHQKPEGGGP